MIGIVKVNLSGFDRSLFHKEAFGFWSWIPGA